MNDSKPRAVSRTWAAHVTYQECGVVTGNADYTVKMTRTPGGLVSEVDGAPCDLLKALRILHSAGHLSVTAETLDTPAHWQAPGCPRWSPRHPAL